MYGIKGNIDATIQMQTQSGIEKQMLMTPFEIKTGRKESSCHRAQTTLYTLLLSDRYDMDVTVGTLFYLEQLKTNMIPKLSHEIRALLISRNRMSVYLSKRTLSSMIKKEYTCKNCYALDKCVIYHKMIENGTVETSGLGSLFDDKTSHIQSHHIEFFKRYTRLINLEESEMNSFKKEIWSMSSKRRENEFKRCFSRMKLVNNDSIHSSTTDSSLKTANTPNTINVDSISAFKLEFKRENDTLGSLLDSQIMVGDPIVISSEKGHVALALGFVESILESKVTVLVDRNLSGLPKKSIHFNSQDNQSFDLNTESSVSDLYRIDKDELSSGMGLLRENLVSLFTNHEKLRKLIVDLEPPMYSNSHLELQPQEQLNSDQELAIHQSLKGIFLHFLNLHS